VVVRGPSGEDATATRLEVYRRVQAYQASPRKMVAEYAEQTALVREEIQAARDLLPQVCLPDEVAKIGLNMIHELQIDSLRAEITLFEAARAYAAMDARLEVVPDDLRTMAPMALRMRRSQFMTEYFAGQQVEETELNDILHKMLT
jgi:Mg-chelatase subunit ChlI